MPQRPKQKPFEEQSRFVQLLYEYMWRQRPPLKSAADLADHVQMSRQTIYQWLHKDVIPQPGTLMLFAQHTNMSPVEISELFQAAGHPTISLPADATSIGKELYALQRLAEQDPSLSDSQRRIVTRWLLGLSQKMSTAASSVRSIAEVRERYEGERSAPPDGYTVARDCAEIPG